MPRVILLVLDSVGIGALPDAGDFGDGDCNTLRSCYRTGALDVPVLSGLGLFDIEGLDFARAGNSSPAPPRAALARMAERSRGKDTTVGHWEIAGLCSKAPLPTYPEGFPPEIIEAFARETGRPVLCNRPFSGTAVIEAYAEEQRAGGGLIVYTSADSVFQIAAHEEVVPLEELYRCCRIARALLTGPHAVGRVIARPFTGSAETGYTRTAGRHDFSLAPPEKTLCDHLADSGIPTVGVGKIGDIFAGRGIAESFPTRDNEEGMDQLCRLLQEGAPGLLFVNLVDFDMKYGHRRDPLGYAEALNRFDRRLGELLPLLGAEDVLLITADHGCDPAAPGTDHTREYTPMLCLGDRVRGGVDLGTRATFADIAATVLEIFSLSARCTGESFWPQIAR